MKNNIISILNLGSKYVPCIHNNIISFYQDSIKNFNSNFNKFNNSCFLQKQKHMKDIQQVDSPLVVENTVIDANLSLNCDSIDCLLKLLKNKRNLKLPFLEESLSFRPSYFQNLTKTVTRFKPNLLSSQIYYLNEFTKNRPFSILEADKNIGSVILSNELLDKLVYDHLSDIKTYIPLDVDPLMDTVDRIKVNLNDLVKTNSLSKTLFNLLIPLNSKLGSLRLLPKLHKNKFSCRPIINSINHPTSKLCMLVDLILKPIISDIAVILKDSQQLLQECRVKLMPKNTSIYSCDFESLYSNIISDDAIRLICEYMLTKLNSIHLNIIGFRMILVLIFNNNVFLYKNNYYKQILGIAMGCKCGPSIANLFVYILEKHWINLYQPIVYKRFIDDIFLVTDGLLDEFIFKNQFLNLKLNIVGGKVVSFLDLNISVNKLTNLLNFSLFLKPTNTFSYLLTSSNHPSYIFKNIPVSLFLRISRICSDYTDYLYFARKLSFQLISRGYNYKNIFTVSNNIGNKDRDFLLPYKVKDLAQKSYADSTFLISEYSNCNPDLSVEMIRIWKMMQTKFHGFLENTSFKPVFTIANNLSSILIHNFNFKKHPLYKQVPCNEFNCKTCKFVFIKSSIDFLNFKNFPILCYANCNTKAVVYCIYCKLCNEFYVGQTKRIVKDRIKEHLEDINNFIPYFNEPSEVSNHFNLKNHDVNLHFSFFILKYGLIDEQIRFSIETDFIHIVKSLNNKIINAFVPYMNNIKFIFN